MSMLNNHVSSYNSNKNKNLYEFCIAAMEFVFYTQHYA